MGSKIGEGSYTNTELPHQGNVTIGRYSSVGRFVNYHTEGDHLCVSNRKCVFSTNWMQPEHPKKIEIVNDVWIGDGVTLLEDIKIGDGAIIGAGAVVSKDVPPYAVVVGNPQEIKRFRFDPDRIEKLLEIKWWDWDNELIQKRKDEMLDIDTFLQKYGKIH